MVLTRMVVLALGQSEGGEELAEEDDPWASWQRSMGQLDKGHI